MAQHPEQVQRIEMVGGVGEDFCVDGLGRLEIAGLMTIDRPGEQRTEIDGMPDQAHRGMIVEPVADSNSGTLIYDVTRNRLVARRSRRMFCDIRAAAALRPQRHSTFTTS